MSFKTFLKDKKGPILLIILAGIILALALNIDKIPNFFSWLGNVFFSIILGGCIAFVINILMDFFSNKVFKFIDHKGLKLTLSLLLSLIIIIAVIIAVILVVVPQLLDSFKLLVEKVPSAFATIRKSLSDLMEKYPALQSSLSNINSGTHTTSNTLVSFLKDQLPKTLSGTASLLSGSFHSVTTVLIALLFSLYILIFKGSLEKTSRELCYAFLSKKAANKTLYICHLLSNYFKDFIFGRVFSSVSMAVLYLIPALIFKLPYTLMMATIFAVFSIVPLFGALVSWIIGLFLIATESINSAIIFTIAFVIILLLVRNVIYPKVIGKSIGLPDFWVLFAVIVGGKMFGIVGMLTAVPVFALIYRLIAEAIQRRVNNNPEEADEILNKKSWDDYNPLTDEFENKPVELEDKLKGPLNKE